MVAETMRLGDLSEAETARLLDSFVVSMGHEAPT